MKLKSKKRNLVAIIIIILIGIIIVASMLVNRIKKESININLVIESIRNESINDIGDEKLKDYKEAILGEIDATSMIYIKKKGYCALGYISIFEGEYEIAKSYLIKAVYINDTGINQAIIYNGLSQVEEYLENSEMSQEYFQEAENRALKLKDYEYLNVIYRQRAEIIVNREENGVKKAIDIMNIALNIPQNDLDYIRNYTCLARLYMLDGAFELAKSTSIKALSIAYKIQNIEQISKSGISLAINYYSERRYENTIAILENVYTSDKIKNINDKIEAVIYLIKSYSQLGDFTKVNKYMEIWNELLESLSERQQQKELNLLYTILAESKLKEGDLTSAKNYIKASENIYEQDKLNVYEGIQNTIRKINIDISVKEDGDYKKALTEYEDILDMVENLGIKVDIRTDVIDSILNISKDNDDIEVFEYYVLQKESIFKKTNYDDMSLSITHLLQELEDAIVEDNKEASRRKSLMYIFLVAILLIIIVIVSKKNRDINLLNEELKSLTETDSLTEVYNKRFINEYLNKLSEKKERVSLMIIDIDYFKLYNDNYGHIAGDSILQQVAGIIKDSFKDDIVARYGGEEFIIVSRKSKTELAKDLENFMTKLEHSNIEHKYSLVSDQITISAGIEEGCISNDSEIVSLVQKADKKLYVSKENGRNRYTV